MSDKKFLRVLEHQGELVQRDLYIAGLLLEAKQEFENARQAEKGRSDVARQYSIVITELEGLIGRMSQWVFPTAVVCQVCGDELAVTEARINGDGEETAVFTCLDCHAVVHNLEWSASVPCCATCGIENVALIRLDGKPLCMDCHETARFGGVIDEE